MTPRLITAWPLERYQLWLSFLDGTEGTIDLEAQLSAQSLTALRDERYFRHLKVDRVQNLLVWPNGVQLSLSTFYRELKLRKRRQRVGFL